MHVSYPLQTEPPQVPCCQLLRVQRDREPRLGLFAGLSLIFTGLVHLSLLSLTLSSNKQLVLLHDWRYQLTGPLVLTLTFDHVLRTGPFPSRCFSLREQCLPIFAKMTAVGTLQSSLATSVGQGADDSPGFFVSAGPPLAHYFNKFNHITNYIT